LSRCHSRFADKALSSFNINAVLKLRQQQFEVCGDTTLMAFGVVVGSSWIASAAACQQSLSML
jgi:hypothetical protein